MRVLALALLATVVIPRATVDNLDAAIEREANAERRYLTYARKADADGDVQVAKLFRAAALSESILRENHEEVLRAAGITVKRPSIEGVQVGTTEANLTLAIGATNEGTAVYYEFVKQARSDDAPDAERTLQYALAAERAHRDLFKRAAERLRENPPEDYYVGRISGETTTTMSDREPYTAVR
jgi:rubrerythrin